MKREEYAYIVGRLRALETQMLSGNLIERMLDAGSADEAYRALSDFSFLSVQAAEYSAEEFQKVISKGIKDVLELIKRMSPDNRIYTFLSFKYDCHNLKTALKARLAEKGYADIKHALTDMGSIPEPKWEQFVLNGEAPCFKEKMAVLAQEAVKEYENTGDPQIVDTLADMHYLDEIIKLSKELKSDLLSDYVKRLVDLTNLKTFIRCMELKKDVDYLKKLLLSGGNIEAGFFSEYYGKGYEDLRMPLEHRLFSDDLIAVLDEFIKERSLTMAEKKANECLENFMKISRRMSFGPEPVAAFFWKFESHMQIIRMILVGKLNKLENEEVRRSLITI